MLCKLVTCPVTAHLEQIEYDESPLGILIEGCTRDCPLDCSRACATLMDLRNALANGEIRTGALLLARSCLN